MTTSSAPLTRPQPPIEPALEDCCCGGCSPCIFELHEMALERYARELAAYNDATGNHGG